MLLILMSLKVTFNDNIVINLNIIITSIISINTVKAAGPHGPAAAPPVRRPGGICIMYVCVYIYIYIYDRET